MGQETRDYPKIIIHAIRDHGDTIEVDASSVRVDKGKTNKRAFRYFAFRSAADYFRKQGFKAGSAYAIRTYKYQNLWWWQKQQQIQSPQAPAVRALPGL
jgi:hypothetical protein